MDTTLEYIWSKTDDCEFSKKVSEEIIHPIDYMYNLIYPDEYLSITVSVHIDNAQTLAQSQIGHYTKCSSFEMIC